MNDKNSNRITHCHLYVNNVMDVLRVNRNWISCATVYSQCDDVYTIVIGITNYGSGKH